MRVRAAAALVAALGITATPTSEATAQPTCGRVAVLTLPGITWEDIQTFEASNILRIAEQGSAASMSVRTNTSRTSYASGFATLGAGARVDGARTSVGAFIPSGGPAFMGNLPVSGLAEMRRLADEAGYGAVPGALADVLDSAVAAVGNSDLGLPPASPHGYGRWALLAAMSSSGKVDAAATGSVVLRADPTAPFGVRTDAEVLAEAIEAGFDQEPCVTMFVDPGDLTRADVAGEVAGERSPDLPQALDMADDIAAGLLEILDPERDLLIVVSPTSPRGVGEARLGVAIARGPGFAPGQTLESASTRRPGVVTLPDVAPTIVEFHGEAIPDPMNGRPWRSVPASGDPVEAAVALNERSTFVDSLRSPVSTGFVIFQVVLYGIGIYALRSSRRPKTRLRHFLETGALAVAAFPAATFLAGLMPAHELGVLGFVAVPAAIAIGSALAAARWGGDLLDALLAIAATTVALICLDLALGAQLQMNTVFGYSPIVAGRFDGLGNIAFAILGACTVITGALLAHRGAAGPRTMLAVALLFAAVVAFDGAPGLGGDVGGVLTLVPSLGITFLLLSGKRPTPAQIGIVIAGAVAALALFLAIDVARPPEGQTHLARTFQDVREGGMEPLVEVIMRKAEANLRVFKSTIWTYLVPPAVATLVYLLFRPRGRWRKLQERYPRVRAGLTGGLVLAVVGFALNDSGIVIPAMILSYLVPMTLLLQVSLAAAEPEPS